MNSTKLFIWFFKASSLYDLVRNELGGWLASWADCATTTTFGP